jgi:hypothetical protein
MTPTAGPLLFARYAYPPNALGLCGADRPQTLLEYGDAGVSDGGLAELTRTFDGAWPYLELIAGASGIDDPLDARVVSAYWVGNELLDRVEPGRLVRHLDERFRGRLGRAAERVAGAAAAGAVPHHCFHVFAVYPWLGLLRTGIVDEPLRVLDRCRTAPATVLEVDGEAAQVLVRPLAWDGRTLSFGSAEPRAVRWAADGRAFLPALTPGDRVALHWDFVCDVLDPRGDLALQRATRRALRAANVAATAQAVLA